MTEFTQSAAGWWAQTALAGAVVFGLGWVWVRRLSDPARRQKLGGWVVRGGLVAAVLSLFPAWLVLPAPRWGGRLAADPPPADPDPAAIPTPAPPVAEPARSADVGPAHPEPGAWAVILATLPAEVAAESAARPE